MMNKLTKTTLYILSSTLCLSVPTVLWADETPPKNLDSITCPTPGSLLLHTKNMIWGKAGGWKSYERSFAHTITGFLGAQWQGTNLGNIVCLYSGGPDRMTFPIEIHFGQLVYIPTQGAWQHKSPTVLNCLSHHTKNCPFQPLPESPKKDIYQQVHELKNADPSSNTTPY